MQLWWSNRSQPKLAAKQAREAGVELTQRDFKEANKLAHERMMNKAYMDPLLMAAKTRSSRAKQNQNFEAKLAQKKEQENANIRANLLRAARVARKMGYQVKKSTTKKGLVSSYYVTCPDLGKIRISDHDIPTTNERASRRFFDGTADIYATEKLRSTTWWKRAIVLALNGRYVNS